MFNPIKSVLFASNLSPSCWAAFEASIALAGQNKAKLVLLHVIDRDVPLHVEEHLKAVLGEEKWARLAQEHHQDAHQALIGKMSSDNLLQRALQQYCADAGVHDADCGISGHETVVAEGDITQEILSQAAKHECDLIVLGARKGFLKNNSMGSVVKGVMRKSKIPVLFVPPRPGDED